MNNKENIKQLLNKYLEGETSVREEKQLRFYFLFEEVDPEFESFKPLFQFFENEKNLEFSKPLELDKKENDSPKLFILHYWKVAVAAMLILGIGVTWLNTTPSNEVESLSHQEVLIAQKYLNLSLGTLDKNFTKSAELLSNAGKIEESTNKVREMGKIYGTQRDQLQHLNYIDQSFHKLGNIKSIQKSRIKLVM